MAHVIKLKYGSPAGWSYIDLTDSSHGNKDYYPGTPAEGADEIIESGIWYLVGSSTADLIAKIGAIEAAFRMAGAYSLDGIGANQVRLTIQPDGVSETWESPIFEGRLELSEPILGVDWALKTTEVVLYWRRAPYWEYRVAVPIRNDNGSNVTTGLRVYNQDDGSGSSPTKFTNNIEVDRAFVVPGDLPAPIVLDFYVRTASGPDQIWLCQNINVRPSSYLYTLEAETGSADTTDAARSGGKYHTFTIPSGAGGLAVEWPYTTALDYLSDGGWLRCLVSAKYTGTVKFTPYVLINGIKYYGVSSIVVGGGTNFEVLDLGLLSIPAIGVGSGILTAYESGSLGVLMVESAGGTIDLDYAQVAPVDYFAQSKLDVAPAQGEWFEIDCHDNTTYATDAALTHVKAMGTLLGSVCLKPGIGLTSPATRQELVIKMAKAKVDDLTLYGDAFLYCWARKRTL